MLNTSPIYNWTIRYAKTYLLVLLSTYQSYSIIGVEVGFGVGDSVGPEVGDFVGLGAGDGCGVGSSAQPDTATVFSAAQISSTIHRGENLK